LAFARTRGSMKTIDKNSFEPVYIQIARIVSEQIADGTLRPGDQLPTEEQFCKQFSVSPVTVRRAINILVKQGLLSATQGKGTFVKPLDIGEAVFTLQELKDRWTGEDAISVRLLEASIVSVDESVAGRLALITGDRCIHIRRLVLQRDVPTIYHREYVVYDPRRPLVEAQVQITSLEGLLQGHSGEGLRRGQLIIEATNLGSEESTVLRRPPGSSAFRLEHTFYDFGDRPVSWGWFVFPSDLYRLTSQIGAGVNLR
jgi:DNA-binding GntR family transcriptional regulator